MYKHVKLWCMNFKFNILPFTGLGYTVSETGIIYQNNKELETVLIDGKQFVNLEWINGNKLYEKALVILSAFDKIGHGPHLYERIKIIYIDGDENNCFPKNLTYVFNDGPIESVEYPGFFLIPGYDNYVLSKEGILYSIDTKRIKVWSTQKGPSLGSRAPGYKYSVLYRNSKSSTVYQHRILCIVFKKFTGIFKNLTVNHKNALKFDNQLNNLEWVTYSENNKHAWDNDLKLNHRPNVLMRNLITEEILSFRSVRECARYIGDSTGYYVSSRLKDKSGKIYPDYLMFKLDDSSSWPEFNSSKLPDSKNIKNNYIVAKNVFTDNITIIDNVQDSEKLFGIKPAVVLEHARCSKKIPNNGYNFRFLLDTNWPVHTKRHLEIYRDYPTSPGDGIIMIDTFTNEEKFFTSTIKCISEIGIQRSHLYTVIYTNTLYKKRFSFKIFKLKKGL